MQKKPLTDTFEDLVKEYTVLFDPDEGSWRVTIACNFFQADGFRSLIHYYSPNPPSLDEILELAREEKIKK